nr:hypothetical protein [Clostridia bacterium]
MNYPSLLYINDPVNPATDYTVFEDVKLTNLLGTDVIDAIKFPLGEENILARQEFFKELEDSKFRSALSDVYDKIETVAAYDERRSSASTEVERKCAFVGLMRAYADFCRAAASLDGKGRLSSRFSGFFAEELDKPYFKRFTADTDTVYPRISEMSRHTFHITGENMRVAPNPPQSFVERIAKCAADLGLSELTTEDISSRALAAPIIETAASLYPDTVNAVERYCEDNKVFYDESVLEYRLALKFYLRMAQTFDRVRKAGIPLTYAKIAKERVVNVHDAYDITLMTKDEMKIIPNDISFNSAEPFFYLTGANGGGKTTYLRAVAVTVLMFLAGCPIACESGEIYPPDQVFTHFPRDERFDKIGRFEDEERRVNDILDRITPNCMVLLNETYSTTSEESAVELTGKLADRLYGAGVYGIYITHQHGLGETKIPYLNVVVDRDDANRRTYKVAKRRNEQGSLALDVLRRYGLTAEALAERFRNGVNTAKGGTEA